MILICTSITGFITNRMRVKTSSIILLLNLMNNQTEQINYTQTKVGLQDCAVQNKTLYSESVLNL